MLKKLIAILCLSLFFVLFSVTQIKAQELPWEKVVGTGATIGKGFGIPTNTTSRSMVQFGDNLYVGTGNTTNGAEIWRSPNGTDWTRVATGGINDANNTAIWTMVVFNGSLYAGTNNMSTGGELFQSADGVTWTQVGGDGLGTASNIAITSLSVFNSNLYIGTYNWTVGPGATGANLFQTADGSTFNTISTNGLGGGPVNEIILSAKIFNSELYLSIGKSSATGGEIWKSPDGTTWTQSGSDGLGDATSPGMWTLETLGSSLYAANVGDPLTAGSRVFGTSDGATWVQTSINFGVAGMENSVTYALFANEGYLYAGTGDTKGRVFRSNDAVSWMQTNDDNFAGASNLYASAFYHFNGYLYVAAGGPQRTPEGLEIFRLQDQPVAIVATLPATGSNTPHSYFYLIALMIGLPVIFAIRRLMVTR